MIIDPFWNDHDHGTSRPAACLPVNPRGQGPGAAIGPGEYWRPLLHLRAAAQFTRGQRSIIDFAALQNSAVDQPSGIPCHRSLAGTGPAIGAVPRARLLSNAPERPGGRQAGSADGGQQPGEGANDDGGGQSSGPGFGRDDEELVVAAGVEDGDGGANG